MPEELLDNQIEIISEDGESKIMTILFTCDLPSTKKSYVFYYDPDDENGNVYVNAYTEDGELLEVDDDEWVVLEERFQEFLAENEEADDNA